MTATATGQLAAHYLVLVDGDSDGTEFSFWGNANKAARYYARRGHTVEIMPEFHSEQAERAYYARPAWDETSLWNELDGMLFASLNDLAHYHCWLTETAAEMAIERAYETSDRYAWEDEQDRMRAAWGL